MKRSILLILLLVSVMALTACQSPKASTTQFTVLTNAPITALTAGEAPSQAPTDAPTQAPTEPPVQHVSTSACAQTVREQVNAPERAAGQWQSNTGHTRITMDAAVIVPDVVTLNTYAVAGRDATHLDAMHMALGAAPDTDWETDWTCARHPSGAIWDGRRESPYTIRHADTGYIVINYLYQRHPAETVGSYNWHQNTMFGEKRIQATTSYRYEQAVSYPLNILLSAEIGIQENETLPGQSLSLAQARALAETFAAAFGVDFRLARSAKVAADKAAQENNEANNQPSGPWAYWFCFTRCLDGLPVTLTNTAAFENPEEVRNQQYESAPKGEMLTCVVDQGRIVLAELSNPWTVGGIMRDHVKLLSFDEILRIFGSIAPLSIQHEEADVDKYDLTYANTWHITEIRLGYMPVLVKDGGGTWELRPVWDFCGIRTTAFSYDDRPGNVALTIDAIDGTVIDRNYGY